MNRDDAIAHPLSHSSELREATEIAAGTNPFGGRSGIILVAVMAVSMLLFVAVSLHPGAAEPGRSAGADSYSRSAVGHAALVEVLRRSGRPVLRNTRRRAHETSWESAWLMLEPDGAAPGGRADPIPSARQTVGLLIVALPKRRARESVQHPGWVDGAELGDLTTASSVLARLGVPGEVRRADGPVSAWSSEGGVSATPTLDQPQLVESEFLDPLISCEAGVLAGMVVLDPADVGAEILVIADPDLLSNAGLGLGENARIVGELLDAAGIEGRSIVIDETPHGFEQTRSLVRELLRFPLSLGVALVLLAAGVSIWAGVVRFGPPAETESLIGEGKEALINNTAELMRLGGHSDHALQSYLEFAQRDAAKALGLPPDLTLAARRTQLNEIGERIGVLVSLDELIARRDGLAAQMSRAPKRGYDARVVALARRIHKWRWELIRGTRRDTLVV